MIIYYHISVFNTAGLYILNSSVILNLMFTLFTASPKNDYFKLQ